MAKNFYQLLSQGRPNSPEGIRRGVGSLVKLAQDDFGLVDLEKFRILQNAYNVLSNPKQKSLYDNNLFEKEQLINYCEIGVVWGLLIALGFSYKLLDNPTSSISMIGLGASLATFVSSSIAIKYTSDHINGVFEISKRDELVGSKQHVESGEGGSCKIIEMKGCCKQQTSDII